jgi:hypothetical protein
LGRQKSGPAQARGWKHFFALSRLAGLFLFHLRKKKAEKMIIKLNFILFVGYYLTLKLGDNPRLKKKL